MFFWSLWFLVYDQLDAQFFFYVFISILYMFRATPCSSSGVSIVSIQPPLYVTLCRWPLRVQGGKELSDMHTKRYMYKCVLCVYVSLYVCIRWFDTKCGSGRWKSKGRIAVDILTDSTFFVLFRLYWYQSPLVA